MKLTSTKSTLILAAALLLANTNTNAQTSANNLLTNSNFLSGTAAWVLNGMNVEINRETVYGGREASNAVAEVDAQVGLRQKMSVLPGKIYTITYKASRRTTGSTPASVGMRILVTGANGGTFLNTTQDYTNTVFAYANETKTFVVPSASSENAVIIEFTAFNNTTTHGVIVDDIEVTAASASSLPVVWANFTAELRNQQAVLSWKTSSELNNKHYVVERSFNGSRYDSIGVVKAAGNGNGMNSYSFVDAQVKFGNNFYRLRQVDVDDASKYSKVVTIKWQNGGENIRLFPTMATSNINVNFSNAIAGNATVSVYDAAGKMMIRTQKMLNAGAHQQTIDVASLTKGMYYFNIKNNDGSINYTQAFHKVD